MERLTLSAADLRATNLLIEEISSISYSVEDPQFLGVCCTYAQELPRPVRAFLNAFRFREPSAGICVISGYPVDDEKIGKTITHWKQKSDVSSALAEEILLVLFGSLLGDVFGWSTEQEGRIVQDVVPIKDHEYKQMSTGSGQPIWWHTEDAFQPYSSDYIGLLCLRNHERAATTFTCIDSIQLDRKLKEMLFQPRFIFRPVESHMECSDDGAQEEQDAESDLAQAALKRINQMIRNPQKTPVLYGNVQSPYIRIDPYFMEPLNDDEEAQNALNALIELLDARITEIILQPGDFCIIDNYKAVHGRRPFRPKYDGNDRWLKRINVTRDLRKSRCARATSASRIIF